MSEETITPIVTREAAIPPVGRPADRLAMILAGFGAALSIVAAIWFFAGFAENDTRPEHLASALILTLGLFAFAIIPFLLVTYMARKAFLTGTKRSHLLWTVFLMAPWLILGAIAVSHTPLPIWSGLIVAVLAGLLTIWALISLFMDRKSGSLDTEKSQ